MKSFFRWLPLLFSLLYGLQATADNLEEKTALAAKAYNEKRYDTAIEVYQSILNQGYESAALYYNLGNTHYRKDEITLAIYFYEKALKLAPNDGDIIHNLKVANAKIMDKIDEVPEIFYIQWWKMFLDAFTEKNLAITIIVLLCLVLLSGAVYLISSGTVIRTTSVWTGLGLLAVLAILWIAAENKKHLMTTVHEAIIFTPTVEVKSSPDDASTVLFVIHEGTKVKLMDKIGEWQEVKIANGNQGWMKLSDMKVI